MRAHTAEHAVSLLLAHSLAHSLPPTVWLCRAHSQSALFNFQSLLTVLLLFICTCTYAHAYAPSWLNAHKKGFRGLFWKSARVGERLSAWVSLSLIAMAVYVLFYQK